MQVPLITIVRRGAIVATALAAVALPVALARTAPHAAITVLQHEDPLPIGKLKEEVRKRAAIGDTQGVATLMNANPRGTVDWILEVNDAFANLPSEELAKEMTLLRTGWRRAYDSDFFDNVERYFARLRPELRRQRNEFRIEFNKLIPAYDAILQSEPSPERSSKARALSEEFGHLASTFREIGDLYLTSMAHHNAGYLVDSTVIHGDTDIESAYKHLLAALEARKQLDLYDQTAKNLTVDVERLELLVVPPDAPPVEGEGEAPPGAGGDEIGTTQTGKLLGVALGPATVSTGAFEVVPELQTYERLGYALDEIMMLWPMVYLREEGSTARFAGIPEGPELRRTGASAAEVVGSDGVTTPIPMTGRSELIRTHVGPTSAPVPWAFIARVPSDKEQYQGFDVNYSPTKEQLSLALAPAAAMRHEIAGTPVLVLDDNMDGIYGGPVTTWNHAGVQEGAFQIDTDALVIGKSKRAVPFSELVMIDGHWYRLEALDGGRQLTWEPANLRTGKVQLDSKGVSPHTVIVRGSGHLAGCYYDLAASKGAIDLPIGRYELVQGTVREGKRMQVEKAIFLGSPGRSGFEVKPGETTKFGLGAPFDIEFTALSDATSLRIPGKSVMVVGRGGERYQRMWGYPLRPEYSFRKEGTKRASRPQKMPYPLDQGTVDEQGLGITWFPLDLEVEHGLDSAGVEVQLTQKKHPLFGNLESSWR